jgi:hypothetical protein
MENRTLHLVLILTLFVAPLVAQETLPRRSYGTARVVLSPEIDGRLDDAAWQGVEWAGDFVQRQPVYGAEPSKETEFKVVYDDEALYFAFRAHDDPEAISSILERRDRFPGDWIEVNIDSYLDRRTAFSFTFSVSGTRGDEFVSDDGNNWDGRWDPVWGGASQVDAQGWTAEIRIPLSQLRFDPADEQTWGLQVQRRIYRFEERSTWQPIPADVEGWVSNFGDLTGLQNLEPKRRFEIVPYAVGRAESSPSVAGNPFRTGSDEGLDGGVDGKIGITSNLTLDFTLNPDFGQVEADPSEVNLSAFESFFEERRPFFIERQDIFDRPVSPAATGGPFTRDNLFYSRRVGRPPQYFPDLPPGATSDQPNATTILGAFKLTGKTPGGLSIGILDAVTDEEKADIDLHGQRSTTTVEPLTNFFVGRLLQDFRDGDTQFGGIVTAANRDLEDHLEDVFRREAYSGGLDFSTLFHNRDYRFEASVFGSEIRGSEAVIGAAQRSSARYYQRPDNDSATYDPTRTSLSGHAGSLRFERTNNHDLRFQTAVAWRSPGFELNDLGFLRNADQINQSTWVGYRKRNFSNIDQWNLNFNQWLDWDTSGEFLGARFNTNNNVTFTNKMNAGFSLSRIMESVSNTELRGGPSSKLPGVWDSEVWFNSDSRKMLSFGAGYYVEEKDSAAGSFSSAWFYVNYRPTTSLRISLEPTLRESDWEMQYIRTLDIDGQDRFLFGSIDQDTLSLELRVDYSITPNLTIQLYGQPFASSGRYSEFKRITDPLAGSYHDRWSPYSNQQVAVNPDTGAYELDEDLDGKVDATFSRPDFDFRELNSNLVVRWEFSPGSTLFVVWSESRFDDQALPGSLGFERDIDQIFSAEPTDVFLVKIRKWFSP